jgi:hypothetical protein
LEALESPFFRERQQAAARLRALLPGSREAVLAAYRRGGEDVKAALASVLGGDATPESIALLLEAWVRGGDSLANAARDALLEDPAAARTGIAVERGRSALIDAAPGARKLDAIEHLLARDEVERLFLSRKSRSGGTGSYRGQYDVLRPHRELALEVCFHILADRALRMPGASAVGGYRFLRPVAQVIDVWEVRSMALNALLDLATSADRELIARLEGYHHELEQREYGEEDGGWPAEDPEREAFLDDLLATLYRLQPQRHALALRRRFTELSSGMSRPRRDLLEQRAAAALALKAGWYRDAIEIYGRLIEISTSRAHDHYNMACAYASWSLEPDGEDPDDLKAMALSHLEASVASRWSDVGWMEQDKDLDPIRDTERYRRLKATIEARLAGAPDPLPPGSAPQPR